MANMQGNVCRPTMAAMLGARWVGAARSWRMVPQVEAQVDALSHGLSRYLWLLWVVWLAFLAYPVVALAHAHPSPLHAAVVLCAVATFAGVYIWNIVHALRQLRLGPTTYSPWPAIAVIMALALGLTLGDRREWVELFIFVMVSLGPSLPPKRALLAIALFGLLAPLPGLIIGAGTVQMTQVVFQSAVSGIATIIVARVIVLERELHVARDEIARLAVSEERLRFARDLHDLLGHSLSLIALKSELAGKLLPVAPERAASEMRDVENAARSSLQEVREAVAGYRQPSLEDELRSAGQMLAAAGIEYRCDGEIRDLPGGQEAVAAWVVREGVTNVIRHSRARQCMIRMGRDSDGIAIEITDDGTGGANPEGTGSGLAGLAERVAAGGGHCEFGTGPGGGFRVSVTLPGQASKIGARSRQDVGTEAVRPA